MSEKMFESVFAENGKRKEWAEAQYKDGWASIGIRPPTKEQFNGVFWKLDQKINYLYKRVKAGESSNLIDSLNGKAEAVENIDALRAFSGESSVVVVKSYSGNGSGGGVFVADKTDKSTADNAGTVIVSNNGTRWRRVFSALSLYDFGFDKSKNNAADILKLIDASVTNQDVDCLAQRFDASNFNSYPKNNRYFNGRWQDGGVVNNMGYERPRTGNGRVLIGDNAGVSLKIHESATAGVVAIGRGAMAEMGDCVDGIAIGNGAQGKSRTSRDNIAIGGKALENVNATTWRYNQSKMEGTRNIAIGTNALISLTTGQGNVALGRNAGQSVVDTSDNVAIGRNAMSGTAPFGFHNEIYNFYPAKSSGNVAIGANTAPNYIGDDGITIIGNAAAQKIKTAKRIVAVGNQALQSLDTNIAPNGGDVLWEGTESGSYTQSGKRLIVSVPNNHGAKVGGIVGVRLTSGAAQTLQNDVVPAVVTALSGNNIEILSTADHEAEGTAEIKYVYSSTSSNKKSELVTAVGSGALKKAQKIIGVDAFGAEVMTDVTSAEKTVAIGSYALKEGNHVSTVAVGYWVAPRISTESCVFIGDSAGYRWQNTEIARGKVTNSIAIGALARVAGDNEIQIGATGQTLYAPTGVNLRSDLRDKADIAPLEVGLDFVKKLNPISGVYDSRDDYIDELFTDLPAAERAEKLREWWANPVKDGRHKQSERHFWLGAQDLAELEQEFGKLPMLNFRADTYSIEYEMFVPVLIKAIQEMSAEIDRLKKSD